MSSGSVRKGSWTQEEDTLLRQCIQKYGEGKWHQVPHRAGLNRCRKSCRLRWLNYLRPNIKRGSFGFDEVDLISRLHKLLGNRWSLIAGRLPGRTANDVKNHWNTHIKKMLREEEKGIIVVEAPAARRRSNAIVIKPRPRSFSKNSPWLIQNVEQQTNYNEDRQINDNGDVFVPKLGSVFDEDDDMQWLENLLNAKEMMMSEGSSNLWSEEIWGGGNGGGDDNRTQNHFTNFCI